MLQVQKNRAIKGASGLKSTQRIKIRAGLKSKTISGHFGVKVKHCMCVEFWCLARLRAPIYSCTLTSISSVTANIPSSRPEEYSNFNHYYVKLTLILSKVSKVLIIDMCVCIWQHVSMELYYPQNKSHIRSRL